VAEKQTLSMTYNTSCIPSFTGPEMVTYKAWLSGIVKRFRLKVIWLVVTKVRNKSFGLVLPA